MKWLKNFMKGRYGCDNLSMFLLSFSIILTLIGRLIKIPIIVLIAYFPLAISIFRIFSNNIAKRTIENYKFSIFINPFYYKLKKVQNRIKNFKSYKYYKCPNCKQQLRLPRGKGSIIITCPKCYAKFEKRT